MQKLQWERLDEINTYFVFALLYGTSWLIDDPNDAKVRQVNS